MRARYIIALIPLFLSGCGASVDTDSMFREYDDYAKEVGAVTTEPRAIEILDAAQVKRGEAGALVAKGKKKEAVPLLEQATADAHLAYEVDRWSRRRSSWARTRPRPRSNRTLRRRRPHSRLRRFNRIRFLPRI